MTRRRLDADVRWAFVAIAPLAIAAAVLAWSARSHYSSPWWTAILLIGTATAAAGLWLLATNRPLASGMALAGSALTLSSGFAFALNLALLLFSLPLVVVGLRSRGVRPARVR